MRTWQNVVYVQQIPQWNKQFWLASLSALKTDAETQNPSVPLHSASFWGRARSTEASRSQDFKRLYRLKPLNLASLLALRPDVRRAAPVSSCEKMSFTIVGVRRALQSMKGGATMTGSLLWLRAPTLACQITLYSVLSGMELTLSTFALKTTIFCQLPTSNRLL